MKTETIPVKAPADTLVESIEISNQTGSTLFLVFNGTNINIAPGGVEKITLPESDIHAFLLLNGDEPLVGFQFGVVAGKSVLELGADSSGWTASPVSNGGPAIFFNETSIVWFTNGIGDGNGGIAMVGTVSTIAPRG